MKNWHQILLDVPLERKDKTDSLPTPVQNLKNQAYFAWVNAGSPDDLALFMGEYVGFSRQHFFLPPCASKYCPDLLNDYGFNLVEELEPYRLLHIIAGSDKAFSIWCPWANKDSIEYPPLRSGTFRSIPDDAEDTDDEIDADIGVDDLTEEEREEAMSLMKVGRFAEALPTLVRATRKYPTKYGNWFMAGQCYRFTDNIPKAIEYLKQAARLNPTEKTIFLGLGIAFQLYGQYDNAIGSLSKSLEIDPNYDLGYNSLALTQMKKGDFEFALHNYDEALKAMTRRLVSSLRNTPGQGITKFHDSSYTLWSEYAIFGAMFIATSDGSITDMAWPTGEFAQREERDENYEGLLWKDQIKEPGKKTRLFLPNFFNTFEVRLHDSSDYSTLIRAKGTALEALGREDEAQQHYGEAEYFQPIR